ncbi:MAG: ornithine cyclodeaminase family protein [Anaerolineales bacterium]|nr:ornithine cyclodeaminase family protein [Anaerolineales bacterium]
MSLLILNEDELRQTITLPEAIAVVEAAFVALAENRVHQPGRFTLDMPGVKSKVEVEGSYLNETPYYVIRVHSRFHPEFQLNLPPHSGLALVFEANTGQPIALLVDNDYISQVRAGAAGALAVRYLANPTLNRVAVIGSGRQAYIQLKSLMIDRQIGLVSVWGRSPLHVDSYARRMVEDHDLNIEIAASPEAAVRSADLIITATSSQQPLLKADWLKPGVHINAVGSNHPGKQELNVDILQRADVIIADKLDQCMAAGEIHHGLKAGVIAPQQVQGELGDLIKGKIPGRTHPDQITLADLTGVEVQDTVIATLAMEKALFLGLGQRVENPLS